NLEEVFLLALLLQAQSAQGCRETRQLERALLRSRVPITGREVEEAVLESEQQLLPVIRSISPEGEVIDIDGAFCRKRLKSYGAGVGERLSSIGGQGGFNRRRFLRRIAQMPHGDIDVFQDRAKRRVRRGILECNLSVGQQDFNGFDTKRRARGGFFRLCLFRNGGFVFGGEGGQVERANFVAPNKQLRRFHQHASEVESFGEDIQ